MKYSTEPKYRKYVGGYGLLSFAIKYGDIYGKKLMDATAKSEIDAVKSASKRVVQVTGAATGDLMGNKITDKITSVCKTKSWEKKGEKNKTQESYIPPEKRK